MEINQELHEEAALAKNYQNAGTAYRQLGNYEEAKLMFEKSIEINESRGSMLDVAWTLGSFARSQEMQEKFDMAIEKRMRAAKIYADLKDYESQVTQLSSAGELHERLGNVVASKECYKKIVEIYKTIDNAEKIKEWQKRL